MRLVLVLAGLALGIAALAAAAAAVPTPGLFRPFASQIPEDVKKYAPFDPLIAGQSKYLIIGSCETSLAVIANQIEGETILQICKSELRISKPETISKFKFSNSLQTLSLFRSFVFW